MRRLAIIAIALAIGGTPVLAQTTVPVSGAQITLSYAPVVKKTIPAVVNIYTKRIIANRQNAFARDPFFSNFLRNFGKPTQRVQSSLGSGVILSPDGIVVSNYHVIAGATDIRVVLNDRRELDATVLLADKQADLAVLKLKGAKDLPWLPLRKSSSVEVGDLVLAIGNPFGVGQTVSSGIISGLARSGGAVGNARAYFIQTDAPINPGNSGGALVDMQGKLVGINTSILTKSGGSNGIGFAIPSDLLAAFLKQAKAGDTHFTRPWAGLIGQPMDNALAKQFGMDHPEGMIVVKMHPQSPFVAAGLKVGDVVISINGAAVNGPAEMLYHMSVMGVGPAAKVEYFRNGQVKSATVNMITAPDTPPRNTQTINNQGPLQGLTLSQINPAVIVEDGLPTSSSGVIVDAAKGFAAQLGFRSGDILVRVNSRVIKTVADAKSLVGQANRVWDITIERAGQQLSMRFKI